jgi:hypothetical protein
LIERGPVRWFPARLRRAPHHETESTQNECFRFFIEPLEDWDLKNSSLPLPASARESNACEYKPTGKTKIYPVRGKVSGDSYLLREPEGVDIIFH